MKRVLAFLLAALLLTACVPSAFAAGLDTPSGIGYNDVGAAIAHDLKTPMTSVRGFAAALADGKIPPEEQPEAFDIILRKTVGMNELVDMLFAYARLIRMDGPHGFSIQRKQLAERRGIWYDVRRRKKRRNGARMTRILFVCLGNICRSPMAEFVMKDMVRKAGREEEFLIASAATSAEELGNPVYPPARRKLAEHGIGCAGKTARQMDRGDYARFDLLIGMDAANLRNMRRICGGDPAGKLHMLLDFTARPGEVADPWYTGDFDAAWRDVEEGCRALLQWLEQNGEG